jgi:hypothetical protein
MVADAYCPSPPTIDANRPALPLARPLGGSRQPWAGSRTAGERFATFLLPNSVAQNGLGRSGLALPVAEMQINWAYLTRGDMD